MRATMVVAAAVLALIFARAAAAAAPDIRQGNPLNDGVGGVEVLQVGSAYHLTFPSHIDVAAGGGTLTISGSRKDTSVTTMDAYESGVNGAVGALQYTDAYGHHHWHYLALDRYYLLPHSPSVASDGPADSLGRDQKSGFCLVASNALNANPSDCRWKEPDALSLTGAYAETVGPGDNDIYTPNVDGQYIDVTSSLPGPGDSMKYELVQWVNADCRLSDTGPANHTWAKTIEITNNGGSYDVSFPSETPYWYDYWGSLPAARQCLPKETVRPEVSGSAQVGGIVSVAPGSWLDRMATGVSNPFSYQWLRCDSSGWSCAAIPGALSANYAPAPADVGSTLRARVVGNFPGTGEQQTPQDSEATEAVAAAAAEGQATQPPSQPASPPVAAPSPRTPSSTVARPIPIVSLTALLRSSRHASVRRLLRHGLRVRAHCSEACRMGVRLVGAGGIRLAGRGGSLRRHGSRVVTLRLSRRTRRAVRHFQRGTLTLWLHVRSRDGQQQTVSRVVWLRR